MIENVFARPDLGRLPMESIRLHDIPAVAAIHVGLNLLADFVYTCLDPRVVQR